MSETKERIDFQKWAIGRWPAKFTDLFERDGCGNYRIDGLECAWQGWESRSKVADAGLAAGAPGNTPAENIQLLRKYAEAMGGMHDKDCSLDDTCDCSGKPINDAVNRICNSPGASGQADEDEYSHKSIDIIKNLASLVRRLCFRINKYEPTSKMVDQALGYLRGEGLQGSILRDDDALWSSQASEPLKAKPTEVAGAPPEGSEESIVNELTREWNENDDAMASDLLTKAFRAGRRTAGASQREFKSGTVSQ